MIINENREQMQQHFSRMLISYTQYLLISFNRVQVEIHTYIMEPLSHVNVLMFASYLNIEKTSAVHLFITGTVLNSLLKTKENLLLLLLYFLL